MWNELPGLQARPPTDSSTHERERPLIPQYNIDSINIFVDNGFVEDSTLDML